MCCLSAIAGVFSTEKIDEIFIKNKKIPFFEKGIFLISSPKKKYKKKKIFHRKKLTLQHLKNSAYDFF